MTAQGPLVGIKVVEFAGIGPGPFCGMLLSDQGADVVRIDRKGAKAPNKHDVETRGRRSVALDLKDPQDKKTALALIAKADILIEGYRPGVMERLGLGPNEALACNPRLVYGRMTGWGQTGPLANAAGHDINYIALTGALHAMGQKERPAIPLNLVGDFGGGALYLAFGVLAALQHAQKTGQGQVVDSAMTDGTISLMSMIFGHFSNGRWTDQRQDNVIDGASHFYNVYECADGQWISLAAIEPQFYATLLKLAGITDPAFDKQWDKAAWPELQEKLTAIFRQHPRADWCQLMEGSDICFAPVLSLEDAQQHPHNLARNNFVDVEGVSQPAPAPRFSKTPGAVQFGNVTPGQHNDDVLKDWDITPG